jgi:Flp pilus assembly protein TadD
LTAAGWLDEAVATYRAALAIKPDYADPCINLGNALRLAGRLDEAAASYLRAIEIKPDHAEAHRNLGIVRFELNRREEAVLHYRRALEVEPGYAEAHNDLGNRLRTLGRFDEALAHYAQALTLKPDYADAHNNLGVAFKMLGRIEEAQRAFKRALELAPKRVEFHASLAGVTRFAEGDRHLAMMESLARGAEPLGGEQQIQLYFALGKAFGDLAQHARSFRHLREGNALKRQRISYDETAVLEQFERVRAMFTPDLMRDKRGLGHPSPVPIFVIGMPRSGTTLVEQILASHPKVFGAGELTDFERYARRIVAHCGLDWDDACLEFHKTQRPVLTASMVQVRQPIYQSAIGRWRPYRDWLEPLLAALALDRAEVS